MTSNLLQYLPKLSLIKLWQPHQEISPMVRHREGQFAGLLIVVLPVLRCVSLLYSGNGFLLRPIVLLPRCAQLKKFWGTFTLKFRGCLSQEKQSVRTLLTCGICLKRKAICSHICPTTDRINMHGLKYVIPASLRERGSEQYPA